MKLEYHGAGWLQMGRVESSFHLPNDNNNYTKNWLGNAGGLISATSKIDEHWEGGLGLGSIMVQLARGDVSQAHKWYPFVVPFVDEARLTYSTSFSESMSLKINFGAFHYGYNPDVKNFGLYLMHGYIYPGVISSGFTGPLGPALPVSGVQGQFTAGMLSNDLTLQIETDDKPLYDLSVADVATLHIHPAFEIGAGVNFYRLLPMNKKATSPGKDCNPNFLGPYAGAGQENPCYIIEKDAAGNPTDTVTGSLAGTKLMARFRFDPKAFSSSTGSFGKDDMVLYGEAAVLGVKSYPVYYNKILRRIPVMLGFNFPTFGLFNLSVEGQYYASKNSSNNIGARNGSWVPAQSADLSTSRDDWKWSVNGSKVLFGHFIFLAQVANDDLRLGGNHDQDTGVEAMRTLSDWYWASKIAYFF